MEIRTMDIEQAAKASLKGEKMMVGVYGEGVSGSVSIMIAIDRKDVPACIRDFMNHFPKQDPVDMAEKALRVMVLIVNELPPHAQFSVVGPALVLASSTPDGIDGAMAVEVTVRENDFLVEIYDLDNWKTAETVH